jgi:hypothetical protein
MYPSRGRVMVYVAQPALGGPVKIGFCRGGHSAVHKRIAELEPGCPWPLRLVTTLEGGRYEENRLHHRFAHLRIHREWFALEGELALWLRGLAGERVRSSRPELGAVVVPFPSESRTVSRCG